jgi:hypothetical protein
LHSFHSISNFRLISLFERTPVKSLPTSLACPWQEKDGQREEKHCLPFSRGGKTLPLLTKGDEGGLDDLFEMGKV